MAAVLTGPDAERVAALRARQRFFWLDASLNKSGREDVAGALGVPAGALRPLPGSAGCTGARAFFAGDGAVALTIGVPLTTAALSWRLLLRWFVTADDA